MANWRWHIILDGIRSHIPEDGILYFYTFDFWFIKFSFKDNLSLWLDKNGCKKLAITFWQIYQSF
jgi:hypothetical protein